MTFWFQLVSLLFIDLKRSSLEVVPRLLVAIAYVMHKTFFVFPIIGGRKVEHHLQDNITALSINLTPEQIEFLEGHLILDSLTTSSYILFLLIHRPVI
jgi:diketogulonate reductase-like aldo/keto reductase